MALFHEIQPAWDGLRCVQAIHGNYCLTEDTLWTKESGVWRPKRDLPFGKQAIHGFSRPDPAESLRFSSFHPNPSLQSKLSITTVRDGGETSTQVLDFQPLAVVALPSNFRGIRWVLLDSESLKMLDLGGKLVEFHDLPGDFRRRMYPEMEFQEASLHWICQSTTIDIFLYPKVHAKGALKSLLPYQEKYWQHVFNLQIALQSTSVCWVSLGRDWCFPQSSPFVVAYSLGDKKAEAHRWNSATRSFERLDKSFPVKEFGSVNSVAVQSKGDVYLCDQKVSVESFREIYYIPDQADECLIYGFDSSDRIHRVHLQTSQTPAEQNAENLAKDVFDQLKGLPESAAQINAFFVAFADLAGNPSIKRRKLE